VSKRRRGSRRPLSKRCPGCNAPITLGRKTRHVTGCLLDDLEPMPIASCPDCNTPSTGNGGFPHQGSCPFGAAQDATDKADLRWFADHPGQTKRVRPPAHSEQLEHSMLRPGSFVALVTVRLAAPGVSVRDLHAVTA